MFRWVLGAIGTVLTLTACQPSDLKIKSVRERLEAGETVEFSSPGYRRPSCSERMPDWPDVGMSDVSERERVVLKSQSSFLMPGRHSCYRIGSLIDVKASREGQSHGQLRVRKLSLVMLSKLQSRSLKGRFFAKADDFKKYVDDFSRFRMQPSHEGIVTIVEFEYLDGSSPFQKAIEAKEREKMSGDGYQETSADGERVGTCAADRKWTDIVVPQELHKPVLQGKIMSWYKLGDMACVNQGQEVDIKTAPRPEAPSSGKVKITKMKLFRTRDLKPERFNLPGFDFEQMRQRIETDNAARPSDWIIVFDIEPLGGVIAPGECRPDQLTAMTGTDVKATRFSTVAPSGSCLKPGNLVILLVEVSEDQVVEIPVKVLEVKEENGAIVVTMERLGGQL